MMGKSNQRKTDKFEATTLANPHVIIEISWSNLLQNEISKLETAHIKDLGKVHAGFLVKTKPSKGSNYPATDDLAVPLWF